MLIMKIPNENEKYDLYIPIPKDLVDYLELEMSGGYYTSCYSYDELIYGYDESFDDDELKNVIWSDYDSDDMTEDIEMKTCYIKLFRIALLEKKLYENDRFSFLWNRFIQLKTENTIVEQFIKFHMKRKADIGKNNG